MMSSGKRNTRTRISSPAHNHHIPNSQSPLEPSKNSGNEGSRAFMQRWLEPSLQSKPSFEEAGLMRYGVLENMAPLGALPKAKKTGNETTINSSNSSVRKIILRPSGSGLRDMTDDDGIEAKKQLISPLASSPASSAAAAATIAAAPAPAPEEEEKKKKKQKTKSRKRQSLPAGKPLSDSSSESGQQNTRLGRPRRVSIKIKKTEEVQAAEAEEEQTDTEQPLFNGTSTPTRVRHKVTQQRKGLTAQVVDVAVEEALKHYRYPTAWALRTLYDEKSGDTEFDAMMMDVFTQSADEETLTEFNKQMEEKKREGKRDDQGCYYFVPPTTNSRFSPHKPKAAPYAKLLFGSEYDESATTYDDDEFEQQQEKLQEYQGHQAEQRGDQGNDLKDHQQFDEHQEDDDDQQKQQQQQNRPAAKKVKMSHLGATARKIIIKGNHQAAAANGSAATTTTTTNTTRANTNKIASRKRARRDSVSSNSSLSSALSLESPQVRHRLCSPSPSMRSSSRGATLAGPRFQDAPAPQPITTTHHSSGGNMQHTETDGSEPNSPTSSYITRAHSSVGASTNPAIASATAAHGSMQGRLASSSEVFPNLQPRPGTDVVSSPMPHDHDETVWDRRRDAQKITNNYTAAESAVRGHMKGSAGRGISTPVRKTRKTRQSLAAPTSTRSTRSAVKKPGDEADTRASSVATSMAGPESSFAGSRAVTPAAQDTIKKPKGGLRVKSSPIKKPGGSGAGIPRPLADTQASIGGAGTPKDQASENDENCSACGNAGDVVCCDGCPRSFHFECVDMVRSDDLPDEWFCYECVVRKFPSRVPIHKGAFASLLNNLEKSNPRAFSLPKKVQNRFENVKAGADGDYEEISASKAATKKRNGYDEVPDFFKQREDGQAVLCHDCQKPSTEIRAILPCSACPLYWHMDCLDPPMAVPPALKTWRCPAHVEDVLSEAPRLAPAHRFRRVKNASVITPVFTRGIKNNGHIEIDWTDEPDELKDAGWPDARSFGRTYKLSSGGIVLDFIEQLRRQGAGYGTRENELKWVPTSSAPIKESTMAEPLLGSSLGRQVDEMQASLNLIGLKRKRSEGLDVLTSALLSAADENVLGLMARGNADNFASGKLTENDKISLRATLAQMDAMSSRIRHLLGEKSQSPTIPTPVPGAATPPAEPSSVSPIDKPDDSLLLITEPTPPSTVDHAEGSMELD